VHPQHSKSIRELRVIRGHQAAVAKTTEILTGEKRKTPQRADGAGEFVGINAPWKMSGADTAMKREIPGVGAHRDEVLLRDLGLSAEAVAGLAAAGAFGKMRV